MLAIIRNDHANINQLLRVLRKKIKRLEQDEKIDYRLVKAIITYLREYSDQYHHPMEDLIYDYYLKFSVVSDDIASRLPREHKLIYKVTIELDELLDMILLDSIVPKELCIKRLSDFVKLQSAHMAYEEQEVLPAVADSLSPDDWSTLQQQWLRDEYNDPLFGDTISDQYRELATRINQE